MKTGLAGKSRELRIPSSPVSHYSPDPASLLSRDLLGALRCLNLCLLLSLPVLPSSLNSSPTSTRQASLTALSSMIALQV